MDSLSVVHSRSIDLSSITLARNEDKEIGIVAIKHTWDGKRYSPIAVEEINGYYVKKELKDSINHLFIDNFYAGH